jgi:hypothetical protein
LVCQGFSQVEGVDYFDTFSPVAKSAMVCMVFMLAAVHDLELDQIDVWAAYLNAGIDIPIYMKQPKGYKTGDLVCKLNKALYGTKQAGRAWAAKLKGFLEECGFTASVFDPCCFTMQCRGRVIKAATSRDGSSFDPEPNPRLFFRSKKKPLPDLTRFLRVKYMP